jgi:hypothetical protein
LRRAPGLRKPRRDDQATRLGERRAAAGASSRRPNYREARSVGYSTPLVCALRGLALPAVMPMVNGMMPALPSFRNGFLRPRYRSRDCRWIESAFLNLRGNGIWSSILIEERRGRQESRNRAVRSTSVPASNRQRRARAASDASEESLHQGLCARSLADLRRKELSERNVGLRMASRDIFSDPATVLQ